MDEQLPGTLWGCCSSLAACCGEEYFLSHVLVFQLLVYQKEVSNPFPSGVFCSSVGILGVLGGTGMEAWGGDKVCRS